MPRRFYAGGLMLAGLGIGALGYTTPGLIGGGSRPYAYLSVMAFGGMLGIIGALLWRDS
jgi:hypothetical protein